MWNQGIITKWWMSDKITSATWRQCNETSSWIPGGICGLILFSSLSTIFEVMSNKFMLEILESYSLGHHAEKESAMMRADLFIYFSLYFLVFLFLSFLSYLSLFCVSLMSSKCVFGLPRLLIESDARIFQNSQYMYTPLLSFSEMTETVFAKTSN